MLTYFRLKRWLCVFLVLFVPQTVFCDVELTPEEKKETVYKMYEEYQKEFSSVGDMTPQKAMHLLKEGRVLFVDVRKPAEMKVSMLPGTITKEAFLKTPVKFKNKTVVAYCTIGYRSGKFAEEMANKGIHIYNLKGGALAWVFEGGKVYDVNRESKRVHVYGKKWNYLPEGYEGVVFGLLERWF